MICCVKLRNVKALRKILLITGGNGVIVRTIYRQSGNIYNTFEVLTAEVIKSSVFWDITPSNPFNGLHGVISQKIGLFEISSFYTDLH
jgi:hypothetical protein